jgi:redox-sensitive bicupin YhaK (pirin superfamily)
MIGLRKSEERHHARKRKHEVWRSFSAQDGAGSFGDGFGLLRAFDEHRFPPGASIQRDMPRDVEILTYVREGALAFEDSLGRSGVIQAGEFQHLIAMNGTKHTETNASRTQVALSYQIGLRLPDIGVGSSELHRRFSAAQRRGGLCVVASPDGRRESLHIRQDAHMYSAMLESGRHVVHELLPQHSAWLHVIEGEITLGDVILTSGDGAAVMGERAVSLTATEDTEILLLDLGWPRGSGHETVFHGEATDVRSIAR